MLTDEEKRVIIVITLLLVQYFIKRNARLQEAFVGGQPRRYWVHPLNLCRDTTGVYRQRIMQLRQYPERFFSYFRMLPATFDHLLNMVRSDIAKEITFMRKPIEPELRLAVTLHHLAEGSSHCSIAVHYGLGRSTVSEIIYETCDAIWKNLKPQYLEVPTSHAKWEAIAHG